MSTDPDVCEVVMGERGMLKGIEVCMKQQCLMSAVTLIYSAIDSLSALTRPEDKPDTTRTQFLDWVRDFMLPESGLLCTAEDLYGARCGILHTHGPNSSLLRRGQAKALIYYWKAGPSADAERRLPPDAVVIAIEDLFSAFEHAAMCFIGKLDGQSLLAKSVSHHRDELLCYRPFAVATIHVET